MASKQKLIVLFSLLIAVAVLSSVGLVLVDWHSRARERALLKQHEKLLAFRKSLVQVEHQLMLARLHERRLSATWDDAHMQSFQEHMTTARSRAGALFDELDDASLAKPMLMLLASMDRYRDAVVAELTVQRELNLDAVVAAEERLQKALESVDQVPLVWGFGEVRLGSRGFRTALDPSSGAALLQRLGALGTLIEKHVTAEPARAGLLADVDRFRDAVSDALARLGKLDLAATESTLEFERILPHLGQGHSRMDHELGAISERLRRRRELSKLLMFALFGGAFAIVAGLLMWQAWRERRLLLGLGRMAEAMHEVAEGNMDGATRLPQGTAEVGSLAESLATLAAQLHSQRDIIERERERAKTTEDAGRTRSQHLANMSHEMKTSLSGIIGLLELLEQTDLSPEQASYSNIIRTNGESLLALINDVHEQARLEGGRVELQKREFSMAECIDSALGLFRPRAEEKGLELEHRLDADVPARLIGDDVRLRQILSHLIGSAIKFSRGGTVAVEVAVESRMDADVELGFTVRNTGFAVPADRVSEVLQPLVSAGREDASPSERHALGLAICAELVEMMGGRVWVESEPGKEARLCFTVRMEAAPAAAEPAEPSRDTPHKLAPDLAERMPLKILLAEDTEVNQMLMTRLFAKMGYSLDLANNGREAVDLWRSKAYDLILMDIQMPEMDGWEASSIILQEADKTQRPRIVAVTANASEENRQRCMAVGMDDFVSKPFTLKRMQAVVERWGPRA